MKPVQHYRDLRAVESVWFNGNSCVIRYQGVSGVIIGTGPRDKITFLENLPLRFHSPTSGLQEMPSSSFRELKARPVPELSNSLVVTLQYVDDLARVRKVDIGTWSHEIHFEAADCLLPVNNRMKRLREVASPK